jgi:hypothetical protein
MKTIHYVFILGLVAAVFFVEYDLTRRSEVSENLAQKVQQKDVAEAPLSMTAEPIINDQGASNETKKNFVAKFKKAYILANFSFSRCIVLFANNPCFLHYLVFASKL